MYTQDNRLIRAQQWYSQDVIEEYSEEGETIGGYECERWSPIQYDGTIIDYCEIPPICQTSSIRIASCL